MNEIIGHFGLVLAAITALNALIASRRVNTWFPNDPSAQADARRFVWRAAGWFGGFCLALECVTLATGAGAPICLCPMSGASGTVGYIGWAMWIAWVGG